MPTTNIANRRSACSPALACQSRAGTSTHHAPNVLTSASQANCSGWAGRPRSSTSAIDSASATKADSSSPPVNSASHRRVVRGRTVAGNIATVAAPSLNRRLASAAFQSKNNRGDAAQD